MYATAINDPHCPSMYSFTKNGQPCSPVGLTCAYPGVGDQLSDGCFATAMLWCRGDAGTGDSGSDAGSGSWTAAQ